MAIGFGQCMLGYMVWDLMRLIDFVADLPEIDEKRIGCVGMSGGGQQTIYLAALDERVSLAVTSGYFYGFKEALMLQPANCSCNFIPNIWRTLDMGTSARSSPRAPSLLKAANSTI
jgi:cephalosporin-C deacetylase-like acetyl esterase